MPLSLRHLAVCLAATLLTSRIAVAQQPQARTVIFLDPAHGGADTGAHLSGNLLEKDFTLAFAARLRALLSANGFTLISTRDSDPTVPFTTDQRAEIANHAHPAACLILHATASGAGIHLATSDLAPHDETYDPDAPHTAIPWDTAQTAAIPQSLRLANYLGVAILHARMPALLTRTPVRPLDNLTCPAVALEIAPLTISGSETIPVTDANYQQHVAQAIVSALIAWRTHNALLGAAR